ncbi:MAG: putative bifunctional diguanylate cyclase/phosphodiesterase [Rhizobiaceae bacterium]
MNRAIGADGLSPAMRSQLLSEQIRTATEMTPITVAGNLAASLLILALTYGADQFAAVLCWALVLNLLQVVGIQGWWRSRGRRASGKGGHTNERRAVLNSIVAGSVWGVLPVLALPAHDHVLELSVAVVIAGVLFVAGFALLVLPKAALAFCAPILAGSILSILSMENGVEATAFAAMLAIYTFVMAAISLRYSRNLVSHLVQESTIREQNDIISLLLKEFEENSSDWLWEFDREGTLRRVSERFAAAAGTERGAMVGLNFVEFLNEVSRESQPIVDEVETSIAARQTISGVELLIAVGDHDHHWRLTGKPVVDEKGEYSGYIGTGSDITAAKSAERRINYLAHNDPLTGLLNRAKFTDHLKQCVARLERYGSPFVVLYLDLDQFKAVNDSRGHLVGDRLLVEVSARIRSALRESDIAARLGGDEFAIILTNGCDSHEVSLLAARIIELVSKPYEFDDEVIVIGISIGVAIAPINGTRPDQILRNADLALYRAKAEGRGTYRFFESQMDSDVRERRMLELELRQALKDGEFMLYYQPLISAEDNRPTGFEALVRWNHPIRGVVPPAEFIPIAEQTGLIKQIGDWTIHEACLAAANWPDDLIVAVNLSAKHFQLSDITEVVREGLENSGLDPRRLELEITESLLIERPDDVIGKLAEIKQLGVTIAMDDFGTGYSSLSYLLKFPFDKIKIDKSFVTASSEDSVAKDILRSIASLGNTLKIRITAEGVETSEQVEFLRHIACNQLQGYYFARPLSQTDMASYLLTHFTREHIPAQDRADRGAEADFSAAAG